jgi:translation elongation factor EF-G
VTSFRVSRPKTSAAVESADSDSHEGGFLVNLVHPVAEDCFHQSAWMVEGAVVVVDPFSGLSHETAQLLRLLITGGVKPVLFIDRFELALDAGALSEDIYLALSSIVGSVNDIIASCQDGPLVDPRVSVEEGSVIFGSLHLDWAFTISHFATLYSRADEFGVAEMPLTTYLWVCTNGQYLTRCGYRQLTRHIRATNILTQSQIPGQTKKRRPTVADWKGALTDSS